MGVEVDLGVFPLFPLWQALCVKLPYKCQILGMVREVMVGGRFGTSPSCSFGLGIPSLCPAELSLSKWIKPSASGFTLRGRIKEKRRLFKII